MQNIHKYIQEAASFTVTQSLEEYPDFNTFWNTISMEVT